MLVDIVTKRDSFISLRLASIESLVANTPTMLLSADKTLHEHAKLPLWPIVFLKVVSPESLLLDLNLMLHMAMLLG
jgi:hypothetical protein